MFRIYLTLGFQHILDWNAYDHLLFVLTLCSVYVINDWKKIIVLVTAFTIGHSLTLALASLKILEPNIDLIEVLIPITIILTALYNIWLKDSSNKSKVMYVAAAFFGLIHGLGFSSYLNALLGQEESVVMPLLGFNLGVELGQLVVVIVSMLASFLFVGILKFKLQYWTILISTAAIIVSFYLIFK